MDGCERPGANGPLFGPGGKTERAASAACPLVAGPRAQADTRNRPWAVFFSRAGKGKLCTVVFVNYFDVFRSIYVCSFDEFHLDFDFYSN
jgi:hypothetical protein